MPPPTLPGMPAQNSMPVSASLAVRATTSASDAPASARIAARSSPRPSTRTERRLFVEMMSAAEPVVADDEIRAVAHEEYGDPLGTHHGDEFPQLGNTLRENERVGAPPHADGGVAVHALVEEHLAGGEAPQSFSPFLFVHSQRPYLLTFSTS